MKFWTAKLVLAFLPFFESQGVHAEPISVAPLADTSQQDKHSSRAIVIQKLQLVKMMLSTSPAIERAARSNELQIKKMIDEVRGLFKSASEAMNAGNVDSAELLADEALNSIEDISRMAPDTQQAEALQRSRYERLLKDVHGILATYHDLSLRIASKHERDEPSSIMAARKQSERAQMLAGEGRYEEAEELLEKTHEVIISALNDLLGSTALMYNNEFKSAAEEYEYELARYQSFEELVPIAHVELKPDEFTIKLSERYVQESYAIRDAAKKQAAKGGHKEAVNLLSEAVKQIQTALRVLGLALQE